MMVDVGAPMHRGEEMEKGIGYKEFIWK